MIAFPDTSFLCALYRRQDNSPAAAATALHLGAREFLTFDTNQRKLAAAEKLKVKP